MHAVVYGTEPGHLVCLAVTDDNGPACGLRTAYQASAAADLVVS